MTTPAFTAKSINAIFKTAEWLTTPQAIAMTRFTEQVRGQHTGTTPGIPNDPHYSSWIDSYGPLDSPKEIGNPTDPTTRLCATYARRLRTSPIVTVGKDITSACAKLASSTALPAFAPSVTVGGHNNFTLCFDGSAGNSPWPETTPGHATTHPQLSHLTIADGRCLGLSSTPAAATLPKELQEAAKTLPPLQIEGDGEAFVKSISPTEARRYISEAADTVDHSFTPDASRVATAALYAIHAGLVGVSENSVMTDYGIRTAYTLTPPL